MNATKQEIWVCSNTACKKRLPIVEVRGEVQVVCRYCKTVNMVRTARVIRIAN